MKTTMIKKLAAYVRMYAVVSFMILGVTLAAKAQTAGTLAPPQTPTAKQDSAMIFESSKPLIEPENASSANYDNSWGVGLFFSDYGFGGGGFYMHKLTSDLSAGVSLDLGTAKGPKEFGLDIEVKINRIFVVPVIASAQYRLFESALGENFRPYITAGAGPVFVYTTPASQDFFSAFGSGKLKAVPGGFVGAGANFGMDKRTTLGANIRYYIIPYPSPGVESTQGVFLTNFNGLFLTVTYGFNF